MKFLEVLFQEKSLLAKLVGIGLKTYEGKVKVIDGRKTFVAPYLLQANCLLSVYRGVTPGNEEGNTDLVALENIESTKKWCGSHPEILFEVMSTVLLEQYTERSNQSQKQVKSEDLIGKYRNALIASHDRIDDLRGQLRSNSTESAAQISHLNAAIGRLKADLLATDDAVNSHGQHIDQLTSYVDQLEASLQSSMERQSRSENSDSLLRDMAVGGLSGYALGRLIAHVK
jgi:hypothetical protein